MLVPTYQSAGHHIPEDWNLQTQTYICNTLHYSVVSSLVSFNIVEESVSINVCFMFCSSSKNWYFTSIQNNWQTYELIFLETMDLVQVVGSRKVSELNNYSFQNLFFP
jgi:hypothetical protein